MALQIDVLRQIQHLILIRDEDDRVGRGRSQSAPAADDLQLKMSALVQSLAPDAAQLYTRLSAKNRIFMSPLAKGNCSACGLKMPTSVLQHILGQTRYEVCTNCGRILYAPEVKATGVRMGEPDPKYLLSRFSTAKLMVPALKAATREEAIAELVAVLAKEKVLVDPEKVVAAALAREHILTTAVGHGLAFPHMRGVEEGMLTFAAGISPTGIDWAGEKVHLVIFTALPIIASPFYLKLISALAQSFMDDEKLPFVMAATDAKSLWRELNKATRVAVKGMR